MTAGWLRVCVWFVEPQIIGQRTVRTITGRMISRHPLQRSTQDRLVEEHHYPGSSKRIIRFQEEQKQDRGRFRIVEWVWQKQRLQVM